MIDEGFRDPSLILQQQILTLRTGVILRGKMTLDRDECLTKAKCSKELVVININKPVIETLCPLGLKLHTLWTGSILGRWHYRDMREIWVLWKSCSYNGVGCPEHLTPCKKDPMPSFSPSPDFVDRGHFDCEDDILERWLPGKSCPSPFQEGPFCS